VRLRSILGALVITIACAGLWGLTSSSGARDAPRRVRAQTATLWVDLSGGSCRRLSSPAAYNDAQACGSLQAAYNAAQSGDTIVIRAGSYGAQRLTAGTKTLAFVGESGSRPAFGETSSAASNLTFRNLAFEDRGDAAGSCTAYQFYVLAACGDSQTYDNVIIDGLNTGNSHGFGQVGNHFTLKNSEIRNIKDQKGFEGGGDDMLIENNYWHNIILRTAGVHNECAYVDGGNRQTWRGNLFIGCPTMALAFTNWNGGPAFSNVVIETNVFGHTLDDTGNWHVSCSVHLGSGFNTQNTWYGWIVRYNTFENDPCVDNQPGSGQWYGNLGGIDCIAAFTYKYNVGHTCGGTGETAIANATNDAAHPNQAPFYINAPAGDFHLKPGAAAINKGDPTRYPPTDKDGNTRPLGTAPDAGAYEAG
jgi:hypothetical protein